MKTRTSAISLIHHLPVRCVSAAARRASARALSCCLIASGVVALRGAPAAETAGALWSIGKPDGHAIEFAPGGRDRLTFTIGKSVVVRDFAGMQSGSIGFDGKTNEHTYTIIFDRPEPASPAYEVLLDLIYKAAAPRQLKIAVNSHLGTFPVRLEQMKSGDGEEANVMLLAKQHLTVPINAAWLKPASNTITITPLGMGGLEYDAITFRRRSPAEPERAARLEPTVFYKRNGGTLAEMCDLVVPFATALSQDTAAVRIGSDTFRAQLSSGPYDFGEWIVPLAIPASVLSRAPVAQVDIEQGGIKKSTQVALKAAKQWKLYICPKVHNDVGYTDLQPHVNELDNRNTDRALEIMGRFPFYKFNFETAWLVDNYLDCRPPRLQERFFDFAKRNRATINAMYLNLMTGVCSGEELYRSLYFTQRLRRERGGNFDFACLTDAPSHSWFLPSMLSDVGVKAFSNGSNQTRAPILHHSDLNEDSPFWWEGMNGERILFWFARSYTQWKRLTGPDFVNRAASGEYLDRSVPQFLTQFLRSDYAPDAVMVYGAYVDNAAIPKTGEAELIEQWNRQYEFPKLVVASDAEYFSYIESNFGSQLKTYRGDCGAYWEDGVASSAAQTTLNRNSQQILPAAETAHTFANLFQPKERYPAEDFTRAWKNVMFYDEHTWGAHNSISQPDREFVTRQWEVKESYATRANLDARNLLARGFNRLAQNIAVEGDTVIAMNWQGWPRTAPLEVELNSGQQLVEVATGQTVALDKLSERDGWKRVRFLAENVPSMGYKAYAIRDLIPPAAGARPASGDVIESRHYRLTIDADTGGIKSLFDKAANRELAAQGAQPALNEYLYVTGGDGSRILNLTFGTPPAVLVPHKVAKARILEHTRSLLGERIVVETSCSNAPSIRSEYTVYDAIKRVDIVNTVEKVPTRTKEACYFAFPFAAARPAFEFQIQNGWCRPNEDQMPGACREWFTPQNLVHLRDGDFDVAWSTPDAPLVCLTDINRGKWPAHLEINNGHVYSYIMHNYWFTNYRAEQGGRLRFRYAITSGRALDRVALARFDADTRAPVLAYPFVSSFSAKVGGENPPLAASSGSLMTVADASLQMVTVKQADDGDGIIVRLREIAGKAGEAEVALPHTAVKQAWLCNGIEVNQKRLAVENRAIKVPYLPNRFITIRIRTDGALLAKK